MTTMKQFAFLVCLGHLCAVHAQDNDIFNYGIGSESNFYQGEDQDRPSFAQDFWRFMRCNNPAVCKGYPNKFPRVSRDPTYGWNIGDQGNNCRWCPEGGPQNCGVHKQSPINLQRFPGVLTHPDAKECIDWHWMQYRNGTCSFEDHKGHFTIERHALQLHTPTKEDGTIDCVIDGFGAQWPRLDYSKGFPHWWWLARTDIMTPSQHHQEGFQYAAEVTLAHFYSEKAHVKNEMGHVTMFMQDYPDEEPWPYLDKLICQWREAEEEVRLQCGLPPAPPYGNCRLFRDQTIPTDSPAPPPTPSPTDPPTQSPTPQPTDSPTPNPTASPTSTPTSQPSPAPSQSPSAQPSSKPSSHPSAKPSFSPSSTPTAQPSLGPTDLPTFQPSPQPSSSPSLRPSASPSQDPTLLPSPRPSVIPSQNPSQSPTTRSPTQEPTNSPTTDSPSAQPSDADFGEDETPTFAPAPFPTHLPTRRPSFGPSSAPTTTQPTGRPSAVPSASPSLGPEAAPSSLPTSHPTATPEATVTDAPTAETTTSQPIPGPTGLPIRSPTVPPTALPTAEPTRDPTVDPTSTPTEVPTPGPTAMPTAMPTIDPTAAPTEPPTLRPTETPTAIPTEAPTTADPTAVPTFIPTEIPTAAPTAPPTAIPTEEPTTAQPTTAQPTTAQPTTAQPTSAEPTTAEPTTAAPTPVPTTLPTKAPTADPTSSPVDATTAPNTAAAPTFAPVAAGQPIDVSCDQCPNGNCHRMCNGGDPCCQPHRTDTAFCWEIYDRSFPGNEIFAGCSKCCEEEIPNPDEFFAEPREDLPKTINCSDPIWAADMQRYCKHNGCCSNPRSTTAHCKDAYAHYDYSTLQQICHYCCHPSIDLPPERRDLVAENQSNTVPAQSLMPPKSSGLVGDRGATFLRHIVHNTFENSTDTTNAAKITKGDSVRGAREEAKSKRKHLQRDNTGKSSNETHPHPRVFHIDERMYKLTDKDFEPFEEDRKEYFQRIYDDYKERHRRMADEDHAENYEDVHFWPYEWLLKVGTEYYFRYEGTQVVPPCRQIVHWRVMKDPVRVHKRQIDEINRLLAWRINPDNCVAETAGNLYDNGNKVNMHREIQYTHKNHRKVFCECKDWPSQFELDNVWCTGWQTDEDYNRFYSYPYSFPTYEWLPGVPNPFLEP